MRDKILDWGLVAIAALNVVTWALIPNIGAVLGWGAVLLCMLGYMAVKSKLQAQISDLLDGVEIQNLQDELDFYKGQAAEAVKLAEDMRAIATRSLDHASEVNADNKLYIEDERYLFDVIKAVQEYVPGKVEMDIINARIWSTGYFFRENKEKETWDLYVCRSRRPKEEESDGE